MYYVHTVGDTALHTVQPALALAPAPEHTAVPLPVPAPPVQLGQPVTVPSVASVGHTPAGALHVGPCDEDAAGVSAVGGAGMGCTVVAAS